MMRIVRVAAVATTMTLWAHVALAQGPQVMTWSVDGDMRHDRVPALGAAGQRQVTRLSER